MHDKHTALEKMSLVGTTNDVTYVSAEETHVIELNTLPICASELISSAVVLYCKNVIIVAINVEYCYHRNIVH